MINKNIAWAIGLYVALIAVVYKKSSVAAEILDKREKGRNTE